MADVDSRGPQPVLAPAPTADLRLTIDLPPRLGTFLANLRSAFGATPHQTGPTADFWPDVLVARRFPRNGLLQSLAYHLLVMAALYGIAKLPQRIHVSQVKASQHTSITYYSVADELPAFESQPEPARESRPADPLPAAQEVMSLPRNAEHFRQRVITPDPTPLKAEQKLPNLMAWNAAPPSAPAASGARDLGSVWKMLDRNQIVAPAPESGSNFNAGPALPVRAAVPPPPDSGAGAVRDPELPVRAAVAPPVPDVPGAVSDRALVLRPRAAVAPVVNDTGAARGTLEGADPLALPSRAALPPAAPSSAANGTPEAGNGGAGAASAPNQGSGQAIVVGLNPAAPNGELQVPRGNLNGAFAGSPNGRPDATGAPAIIAGGNGPGGSGTNSRPDAPAGLVVHGTPATSSAPVVVAAAPENRPPSLPAKNPNLFAMRRANVEELARATAPNNTVAPAGSVEGEVFHTRRYYSLTLNMPNFTSASGSWVIRFAAADQTRSDDDLQPPIALVKVDPAYPVELMKAGVEGNVTLYAIIRADGSVGDVRVLRGLDDRLDEFARTALLAWKFQPATRHGSAVDLEAVVQIPFHPARPRPVY